MNISNSFAKGWKPSEARIILSSLSKAEISMKPDELTAPTTCIWNFLMFNRAMLTLAFGKAFSVINNFIFFLAKSNVSPDTFTSPTEGINKSPVGVTFVGRDKFSPIIILIPNSSPGPKIYLSGEMALSRDATSL